MLSENEILTIIRTTIENWHRETRNRPDDYEIVTEEIRSIRELNRHRDSLDVVIKELVEINTEIWHEEDKVRSDNDEVVLRAIRNINPLNQHRNDLIEEIDEIVSSEIGGDDGNNR